MNSEEKLSELGTKGGKKSWNDKVLANIYLPPIRNSRGWGMGRMPVWLPDGGEKAGRTGVKDRS